MTHHFSLRPIPLALRSPLLASSVLPSLLIIALDLNHLHLPLTSNRRIHPLLRTTMDAKPDELVIALGSSHVARILEHLHDHALNTDVDFEDVVPGLSVETCMKVWE